MSRLRLKWSRDPFGEMLGTGYKRFESSVGINGLAKLGDDRIDILAVVADSPGKGQFRRFVSAAKRMWKTVVVWEDWNPVVTDALQRYGFSRISEVDGDGKRNTGMMFSR